MGVSRMDILRSNPKLFAAITLFAITACDPPATNAPPAVPYTPRFAYPLQEQPATDKLPITLAIVQPARAAGALMGISMAGLIPPGIPMPQGLGGTDTSDLESAFARALAADVQKLLVNRGFSISGPFADLNDMTFPQKKQADVALVPSIAIQVSAPKLDQTWKDGRAQGYMASGDCTVAGQIEFRLIEPLSGQVVWLKRVDVPPMRQPCSAEDQRPEPVTTVARNGVARLLESTYPVVMQKVAIYFVREEIEMVKKQSAELREKKVY